MGGVSREARRGMSFCKSSFALCHCSRWVGILLCGRNYACGANWNRLRGGLARRPEDSRRPSPTRAFPLSLFSLTRGLPCTCTSLVKRTSHLPSAIEPSAHRDVAERIRRTRLSSLSLCTRAPVSGPSPPPLPLPHPAPPTPPSAPPSSTTPSPSSPLPRSPSPSSTAAGPTTTASIFGAGGNLPLTPGEKEGSGGASSCSVKLRNGDWDRGS